MLLRDDLYCRIGRGAASANALRCGGIDRRDSDSDTKSHQSRPNEAAHHAGSDERPRSDGQSVRRLSRRWHHRHSGEHPEALRSLSDGTRIDAFVRRTSDQGDIAQPDDQSRVPRGHHPDRAERVVLEKRRVDARNHQPVPDEALDLCRTESRNAFAERHKALEVRCWLLQQGRKLFLSDEQYSQVRLKPRNTRGQQMLELNERVLCEIVSLVHNDQHAQILVSSVVQELPHAAHERRS